MPFSKRDFWDLLKGIVTDKPQTSDKVVNERGDEERRGVVEAALSTNVSSGDSLRELITKALTSPSEKEAERPPKKTRADFVAKHSSGTPRLQEAARILHIEDAEAPWIND